MRTTINKKRLLRIVCTVLTATTVLFVSACSNKTPTETASNTATAAAVCKGEGATVFPFAVTDSAGKKTDYEIRTDEETVGAALEQLGLIVGEDGYYTTVQGITLDFNKDKSYWAFYENGKYAAKGADQTKIAPGVTYEFRAEK